MISYRLGILPDQTSETEDMSAIDQTKIFYCSRTHSQLSQFVQEVRRVRPRPSPGWIDTETSVSTSGHSCIKHLSLGSRKTLCINPNVSRLGNPIAINERCLELQQPGTAQEKKCPFLPNKDNDALLNDFKDHSLAKIRDIEDFAALGKRLGICPYYATRATVKSSEVIRKTLITPIRIGLS